MAHIRFDDKRIELSAGELRIGTGDEAQVRFDAGPEKGTLAIIIVDPSGTATVRRVSAGATILVNGVALGVEPAPLLHGDRIEVAGRQLHFSDDHNAGSTVLMPALDTAPAPMRSRLRDGASRAVVSREAPTVATLEVVNEGASQGALHGIPAPLAHIGRGEHNDVIVADDSVSHSHARIQRRESGWFVVAMDSRNGTDVSGERIQRERALKAYAAVRFGSVKMIFRSEPLVWVTAAAAIGATVLLVIQDR